MAAFSEVDQHIWWKIDITVEAWIWSFEMFFFKATGNLIVVFEIGRF